MSQFLGSVIYRIFNEYRNSKRNNLLIIGYQENKLARGRSTDEINNHWKLSQFLEGGSCTDSRGSKSKRNPKLDRIISRYIIIKTVSSRERYYLNHQITKLNAMKITKNHNILSRLHNTSKERVEWKSTKLKSILT